MFGILPLLSDLSFRYCFFLILILIQFKSILFFSFLKAVVRCRNVDGAAVTADLLGRTMGSRPEAFRSLVLRSMVRHGRCVRVLGPVFVQLKSILSPYWRQPHPLRYAAWNVIRRHSNAGQLKQLALPPPLLRYLTMED